MARECRELTRECLELALSHGEAFGLCGGLLRISGAPCKEGIERGADQHAEMVRAYNALRGLKGRPSVDLLVFSRADVDRWGDVVGHIINEALTGGRVLYDAA